MPQKHIIWLIFFTYFIGHEVTHNIVRQKSREERPHFCAVIALLSQWQGNGKRGLVALYIRTIIGK